MIGFGGKSQAKKKNSFINYIYLVTKVRVAIKLMIDSKFECEK